MIVPLFLLGFGGITFFPFQKKGAVIQICFCISDTFRFPVYFRCYPFFFSRRLFPIFGRIPSPILIRDPKIIRQLQSSFSGSQTKELCGKIDHISGASASKTIISAVNFHARCTVIMKNAPDQSAPVGLKSIKFRSLPDRHILLYYFKYIHFLSTSFPTRSDMTGFKKRAS